MKGSKKLIVVFISALAVLISACTSDAGVVAYLGATNEEVTQVSVTYFLAGDSNPILVTAPVLSIEGLKPISNPVSSDYDNAIYDFDVIVDGDLLNAGGLSGTINIDGSVHSISYDLDSIWTDINYVLDGVVYAETVLQLGDILLIYDGNLIYVQSLDDFPYPGCTDSTAFNYDPNAYIDDGSCEAVVVGCMDSSSHNYDPDANTPGECEAVVFGCMDPSAYNYNADANTDDDSCIATVYGCTDDLAFNFDADANTDDDSCIARVYGCTDIAATNYTADANTNDDSCVYPVYGCTDVDATNFDPLADTNDSSCEYPQVTICHATGAVTNPYREITVSINGLNGHGKHAGDIIPVPAEGCPLPPPPTPPVNTPNNPPPPAPNNDEDGPGNQGNGGGKPDHAGGGKPDDPGGNGKGKKP